MQAAHGAACRSRAGEAGQGRLWHCALLAACRHSCTVEQGAQQQACTAQVYKARLDDFQEVAVKAGFQPCLSSAVQSFHHVRAVQVIHPENLGPSELQSFVTEVGSCTGS